MMASKTSFYFILKRIRFDGDDNFPTNFRVSTLHSDSSDDTEAYNNPIYPSHYCPKYSCGYFLTNRTLSYWAILLSSIFFLLSTTSFYVTTETQNPRGWGDNKRQGNHNVETYSRGRESLSTEKKQQGEGKILIVNRKKGRGLSEFESYLRQQKQKSLQGKLPPALRNDNNGDKKISGSYGNSNRNSTIHNESESNINNDSNENQEPFNVSQPPNETNVSTPPSSTLPPVDEQIIEPLDYRDPTNTGNPLIWERLPVEFEIDLLVEDATTNDLLQSLEEALEEYIEIEYKKLYSTIDGYESVSKSLKLEQVDLTLSLVDSKWWEERYRRHLDLDLDRRFKEMSSSTSSILRSQLRPRQRDIQEQQQSSTIKLMTIDVDGSVNYSMEVDGSIPTPDNIQGQWSAAYDDIVSQNQLQRAIGDVGIEGVLRLEQVTIKQNSSDQSNNDLTGNTDITRKDNDVGDNTLNNENISDLYRDDNNDIKERNKLSEIAMEETSSKSAQEKSSQLERPSTLSIVFGFILTGIAIIGLAAYAYIFYRKRQKHLRKKRKMEESITFPSATAAVSKSNLNVQYVSTNTPQPIPVPASRSSQTHGNSTILSRADTSYSEDTSYKGIESSIGSEDISDSFASELKLAASLDQQAWDEFQRKKEALDSGTLNRMVNNNRINSTRTSVSSLLSRDLIRSEKEEDEIDSTAIETELKGTTSLGKSFPYGDEAKEGLGDDNDKINEIPPTAQSIRQGKQSASWEPYHSAFSQSSGLRAWEEKKDETSPNDFFALKLKDIEKDLAESTGQPLDLPHRSTVALATDNSASTSDILSEVSELSRYVKRYERRKDRKSKRGEHVHERYSNVDGAEFYPSTASKAMSIGMDGRVYKPHSSNDSAGMTNSSSSMVSSPSSPGGLDNISSYAESYRDSQERESTRRSRDDISFVGDDEESNADDIEDESIRSQRLGISPYHVTNHLESYYKNPPLRIEDNSSFKRTPTASSQPRSSRPQEDYHQHSIGHGQDDNSHPHDRSRSSSSRLAHLRANDAIIDGSNSDVNLTVPDDPLNSTSISTLSAINKGSGIASFNLRRFNKSERTAAVVSAATAHHKHKPNTKSNNRFDKLRGLFEQRTNEQPEPIYPPGEHWQYAGSLGNKN